MKPGWERRALDEIVESVAIGLVRNKDQQDPALSYKYVKMHNITNHNHYAPNPMVRVDATDEEVKRFQLRTGDILFNTRNSHELVGKSCLYRSNDAEPVLFNNNIVRIRFNPSLLPEFASYAFSSSAVSRQIKGMVSGTTNVAGIYYKDLKGLLLPVPPLAEQQRIVAFLDDAFAGIATAKAHAERNLQNARALFESHLSAVFTQRGEGWVEERLGDVATLQRGMDLPSKDRISGSFPLVSSSGVTDTHYEGPVRGPGVVTGRSGSIGNVFYIENDFWPLNTVLYVKEFHGNCPRYVYYLLRHFDLKRFATGTGVPTLNRNFVHNEKVPVPPLSEQERIVALLDVLKEETQRLESIYQRKIAALDELKQSLLHEAFSMDN